MCRLLVYSGKAPIVLADIITRPSHSIINQAFDSRLRIDTRRPINGDGFGVGWYTTPPPSSPEDEQEDDADDAEDGGEHAAGNGEADEATKQTNGQRHHPRERRQRHPRHRRHTARSASRSVLQNDEPCIFTSISPAWNNQNLARLAANTVSHLIFAHVRASTAGVLAEVNCHPFQYGALMWMHNGGIAGFDRIKRKLHGLIRERYFLWIQGSTDSECAFALFLDRLHNLVGFAPPRQDTDPSSSSSGGGDEADGAAQDGEDERPPYDARLLRQAMVDTIACINELADGAGICEPSLLNFAVTDGRHVICTRYVSSRTDEAASLFFSSGTSFHRHGDRSSGRYRMDRDDKGQDIVLVSSEPLTFERADWVTVPTNSVITISDSNVLLHPIIDKYYVDKASHVRNDKYAASKGLLGTTMAIAEAEAETGEAVRAASAGGPMEAVAMADLAEEAVE